MSSSERTYYEQAGLWSGETAEAGDVIEAVTSLWPSDAGTALDVGCGNGSITNVLASRWPLIGGDFSMAALAHVTAPKVALSTDALPFTDDAFDLTMATDVFEHLPEAILERSVREIIRVSSRYIIFCVPQLEPADYFRIDCTNCGARYHAHHHQRRYSIDEFASIDGTAIIESRSVGPRWTFPSNELAKQMRDITATSYQFPHAVCSECDTIQPVTASIPDVDRLERQYEAAQYLLCESGFEQPPCRSELVVLLEKTGSRERGNTRHAPPHDLRRPEFTTADVEPIDFALDRQRDVLETFPDTWTWIPDGDSTDLDSSVLIVQRAPARFRITAGELATLSVYDAVDGEYVPTAPHQTEWFDVDPVRPDSRGYRVHLTSPDRSQLRLEVQYARPDHATSGAAAAPAFGDQRWRRMAEVQRTRAEEIAATTATRIADLEATLGHESARADANAAKVADLYDQLQTSTKRADDNAALVEQLYGQVQSLAEERSTLNALANSLEENRVELERRLDGNQKP